MRKSRIISAAYETVMDAAAVSSLATLLDNLKGVDVAVNAGRADWTTFRWKGHEDAWSFRAERPDGDPFAEAVSALSPKGNRKVTAVVDVFVERSTATRSITSEGETISGQVSLAELRGAHGQALTDMCAALSALPYVSAINLTELQYDNGGFGADDLEMFKADTGLTDWPRTAEGKIFTASPVIGAWRSKVIGDFIRSVAEAVHANGKKLIVDVRTPGVGYLQRATKFGQDYLAMLDAGADQLGVWHFIGSINSDAAQSNALGTLRAIAPEKIAVEVGLWDAQDEAMTPETLLTALKQADRAGFPDVWITPASLLTPANRAVVQAWWS